MSKTFLVLIENGGFIFYGCFPTQHAHFRAANQVLTSRRPCFAGVNFRISYVRRGNAYTHSRTIQERDDRSVGLERGRHKRGEIFAETDFGKLERRTKPVDDRLFWHFSDDSTNDTGSAEFDDRATTETSCAIGRSKICSRERVPGTSNDFDRIAAYRIRMAAKSVITTRTAIVVVVVVIIIKSPPRARFSYGRVTDPCTRRPKSGSSAALDA